MHTGQYICKNTVGRAEIDILTEHIGTILFCFWCAHERKKNKIMHFCSAAAQAHAIKRLDIQRVLDRREGEKCYPEHTPCFVSVCCCHVRLPWLRPHLLPHCLDLPGNTHHLVCSLDSLLSPGLGSLLIVQSSSFSCVCPPSGSPSPV